MPKKTKSDIREITTCGDYLYFNGDVYAKMDKNSRVDAEVDLDDSLIRELNRRYKKEGFADVENYIRYCLTEYIKLKKAKVI